MRAIPGAGRYHSRMSRVKIVVFVPVEYADAIRQALAAAGAGRIGGYEACSFSTQGIGRFTPRPGANPTIGEIGRAEAVVEERIETSCDVELLAGVLERVREAHPYEEPVIDVLALLD